MTEGTRGVVGLGRIGCFVFGAMGALYRSFEPHPTKDQGKKKVGSPSPLRNQVAVLRFRTGKEECKRDIADDRLSPYPLPTPSHRLPHHDPPHSSGIASSSAGLFGECEVPYLNKVDRIHKTGRQLGIWPLDTSVPFLQGKRFAPQKKALVSYKPKLGLPKKVMFRGLPRNLAQ